MGLLDRITGRSHDRDSVKQLLTEHGASEADAEAIVAALETRLSPGQIHDWLAHPHKAHGIVDPEASESFGVEMRWTPINAVANGKGDLVVAEAAGYGESS